ncbi:MAG TPA: hypothetical protein VHN39_07970 [Phenylobacterium sp.]|nr:hypothetical protein [Phenylobacterium sp.]
MRISAYICGLAAVLFSLSAIPANAADHKNLISDQARALDGGRGLQILVAQEEIKSNINPSNIAVFTGGGLIGALIQVKVDSDRAVKAEAAIQPLRAALTGFDADVLARDTTAAALAKVAWFKTGAPAFGRDATLPGLSTALDAGPTGQVAFFTYAYDGSPDLSNLRVKVTISIADKALKAGQKPETRLYAKNLIYMTSITSVVNLPNPSKDAASNAARWSADNGKLARKALAAGFGELGQLIPRALELKEADETVMLAKDKKNTVAGGFNGKVQEDGPAGTLLYSGALIHVQTIAE